MQKRLVRYSRKFGLTIGLCAYIALCVIFGGAGREGLFMHGVLQAIAALGLAALLATWPDHIRMENAKTPIVLLIALGTMGGLQSIPLPREIWMAIPGRSLIAEGYEVLGQSPPALPISLDVEDTLTTIGYVLTPLFIIALSLRIGMRRLRGILPWFLATLGVAAVIFGLLQVFDGRESMLYFYEFTSNGLPVGFFSNVNHQASLLLMMLPFALFLLSELSQDWSGADGNVALAILIVAIVFMLLVGIFGAGSVGGYAIIAPVLILAFLASRASSRKGMGRTMQLGLIGAFAIGVLLVASSPVLEGLGVTSFSDGDGSRYNIWQTTLRAIEDHWIFGTGLGTYESVIPLYEDPDTVTATFVAKAHNDFLQLVMETGIIGVAFIGVCLIWFLQRFISVWGTGRGGTTEALRKFAFISILAVALHSIVDYPARTPAIAAVLGLCLALVSIPDGRSKDRSGQSRAGDKGATKRVVL